MAVFGAPSLLLSIVPSLLGHRYSLHCSIELPASSLALKILPYEVVSL